MSLSLDELAQASYAATAKFLKCDHSHWDWASETGRNQSRAEAKAVAETLLKHLIEMAGDTWVEEYELRAVLAELKGEMK